MRIENDTVVITKAEARALAAFLDPKSSRNDRRYPYLECRDERTYLIANDGMSLMSVSCLGTVSVKNYFLREFPDTTPTAFRPRAPEAYPLWRFAIPDFDDSAVAVPQCFDGQLLGRLAHLQKAVHRSVSVRLQLSPAPDGNMRVSAHDASVIWLGTICPRRW